MLQKEFQEIITNYQIDGSFPIIEDFETYLEYLAETKTAFKPEEMNLPLNDLRLLNLRMSPPEKPKESLGSEAFPRLKLFYLFSFILGLLALDKQSNLSLNMKKVNQFCDLSAAERYLLLLNIFWGKIPWNCLEDTESDWEERYTYLNAFLCCPVGKEIVLEDENSIPLEGKRLKRLWPQCGPFLALILPSLRNFSLLEYTLGEFNQVGSLLITPLGKEVFTYFHWQLVNSPQHLLPAAWEMLEKGQLKEAKQVTENILKENDNYPDSYNLLGAICLKTGDYSQALSYYQEARRKGQIWLGFNFRDSFPFQAKEKQQVFLKSLMGLALSYHGQKNWLMTAEILEDILQLDPQDSLGVKFFLKDMKKKIAE